MGFSTFVEQRLKAMKEHTCETCGVDICRGETYVYQKSVGKFLEEDIPFGVTEHRYHIECYESYLDEQMMYEEDVIKIAPTR